MDLREMSCEEGIWMKLGKDHFRLCTTVFCRQALSLRIYPLQLNQRHISFYRSGPNWNVLPDFLKKPSL
jgi:hypothetical protein